jgi:alpha-N-arabinofuranosidase
VTGPYVPWKKNPILTQRNLDPGRDFPITCTGHADFVETPAGEWWSVFLGCRPYRPFADNCFNTGRETFLAPVRWQDGWPRISPGHKRVQYAYPVPVSAQQSTFDIPRSGNFTTRDDFTKPVLNKNWMFLRTPRDEWFSLTDRPGYLAMRLQPASCADSANPAFIGRRQQHAEGSVTAKLEFAPQGENEKAGLLVFQNERHFYFLCVSDSNGSRVVELYASSQDERQANHMERLASEEIGGEQNARPVLLRIEAHGNTYSFFFADDSERWTALREHLDAAYLSTKKAAGFVGCVYAMYATSLGLQSNSAAYFDWFGYKGDDEVYR